MRWASVQAGSIGRQNPQLVRKLVFASSMTKREGARPQFWEHMGQADFSNMSQPLKDAFLRVRGLPGLRGGMKPKGSSGSS